MYRIKHKVYIILIDLLAEAGVEFERELCPINPPSSTQNNDMACCSNHNELTGRVQDNGQKSILCGLKFSE